MNVVKEVPEQLAGLLKKAKAGEDVVFSVPGEGDFRVVFTGEPEQSEPSSLSDEQVDELARRRGLGAAKDKNTWSESFWDPMTEQELEDWGH